MIEIPDPRAVPPVGRRRWLALAGIALLGACKVIPAAAPPPAPPPPPPVTAALPTDQGRHRVALLLPMTGPNAAAGQSLANATTMALLDTNAANLRITTYDTNGDAPGAAARAVAEGNRLILGPLMGEDAAAVAQTARPSHVPVISYSNDVAAAGEDVFVMGNIPGQSIARVVHYAHGQGARRFSALIPVGSYGERASTAMIAAVRANGGVLVGMESYPRTPGGLAPAVRRLRAHGGFDAVLIADNGRIAAQAAALIRAGGSENGYAGIAWAILGKFDRAWNERPIFGKRRYMSGASTGRKFNSKLYIRQMYALPDGVARPELKLS